MAHRPYVWIPSIKTIVGNIAVFGNMHVWVADTQSKKERLAWSAQLDEIRLLQPLVVIPGHMVNGAKLDISSLDFTKDYLAKFEAAFDSSNSSEIIDKMDKHFPNLAEKSSLELGAKVVSGEMKWE